MAECGNMPDWHPYNAAPGVRPAPPSGGQSASAGHMFISSVTPPALDGVNLTTERHQPSKHQSEGSYVGRNYVGAQNPGGNCSTSSSLPSGVHMTPLPGCVSHYAGASSARSAMMDPHSTSIDPRMVPIGGMSEEVAHRNGQMSFPAQSHGNPPNVNVNASLPGMQNSPVGPMSPSRQAGYGACKAPCCHPEANMSYQHWEKYGHYHGAPTGPTPYRENVRQTYPSVEQRRYMNEMNIRKDCLEKELVETTAPFPVEHRRTYDYKYARKDTVPRNYPPPANGMMQNYPMQNYNFPNDYQKCPYSVKDYMRRGNASGSTSSKNSSMVKYQEQSVIVQQKFSHAKQNHPMQYQNGAPVALPTSSSASNLPSSLHNSYYNAAQISRDLSRDYPRDYSQELPNRMSQPPSGPHVHGSYSKYQAYHQKVAMQRYSMENHLRSYSRIPGYQSHPKYQECMMRYRELLRLQQTVDYQSVLQEAPKVPSPSSAAPPIAPINLQFDQNGILINSNYIPGNYAGMHGGINPATSAESADSSTSGRIAGSNMEQRSHFVDHGEQSINLSRGMETHRAVGPVHETNERYYMPDGKTHVTSYEVGRLGRTDEGLCALNVEIEVEATKSADNATSSTTTTVAPSMPIVSTTAMEYKNSKDFADKPELDVRQFLANWDESEDEDAAATTALTDRFEASFSCKSSATDASSEDAANSRERNSQEKEDPTASGGSGSPSTDSSEIDIETNDNSSIANNCESVTITNSIQCIRTDNGDEIPTIHIVDNLEAGTDLEKIHTVFGSLASSVLNPISIGEASSDLIGDSGAKSETIVLYEQENGVCTKTLEFSVSAEGTSSEIVEGVMASIIESSAVKTPDLQTVIESSEKSPREVENQPNNSAVDEEIATTTTTVPTSTSSSNPSKTTGENVNGPNLRKQNSFTSDESHNPDDISLPDLQTSECTPISTTLNTPIHSDSEESSEHVSDLTTSTNPIEIIQNSPIISFTHSPIKIEPYELLEARMGQQARQRVVTEQLQRHDSLDFDFDREVACGENTKYTEASETSDSGGVEGLEPEDPLLAEIQEASEKSSYQVKSSIERDGEEFYRTADPLVGMAHLTKTVSEDRGDEAEEVRPSKTGNDEEANCESPDRILESELDTDKCPTMMEPEDDFNRSSDLEKLCEMSLDGSCMMPLISGDECEEPTIPVEPIESGDCFAKIMEEPIRAVGDLEDSESSGDEERLGKPDEDMWGDVRYMDKHLDASFANTSGQDGKEGGKRAKKIDAVAGGKSSPSKTKRIEETFPEEMNLGCNLSESEDEEEESRTETSKEIASSENSRRDKIEGFSEEQEKSTAEGKIDDSHSERRKSTSECEIDDFHIERQKPSSKERRIDDLPIERRKSSSERNVDDFPLEQPKSSSERKIENFPIERRKSLSERNDDFSVDGQNSSSDCKIDDCSVELQKSSSKKSKTDDCSIEESRKNVHKRRCSREAKDSEENNRAILDSEEEAKSPLTKNYTTKHRDSNLEIQVANFNVKIHDNEVIRNATVGPKTNHQESSDDGLDAIEIKINVSRGDVNRRAGKIQEKFVEGDCRVTQHSDVREISPNPRKTVPCTSGKKCCRKRRKSMPDGYEPKKPKKMEEEISDVTEHYTPKKISRGRNSGSGRHKIRRSMDDELLFKPDRSRKDTGTEERNFHLEMAKAFNLPWPRNETPETDCSSLLAKEDKDFLERRKEKKMRSEKHTKESRALPSPAYNSTENSSTLDFDNFDVAPHQSTDTDPDKGDSSNETRYGRIKRTRLEDRDRYRNPSSYGTSFDELSSLDAFEINLNTVPIYTTKDGRVTYSPNRNYTYRALIMEARQREGYPAVRKLHYPRHGSSRAHYRDAPVRKIYKRRQDERSAHEKKRRSGDYHAGKFKCPASARHHAEEVTEARLAMRPKKHENRRRETRTPSEFSEFCSDDQTRGYADECATSKGHSVETAVSYKLEAHSSRVQQDSSILNRRPENARKDDQPETSRNDTFKSGSGLKNVMDEKLRSPKHFPNRDENCLVSKIFQGQELEISTRKVSSAIGAERGQNEREACTRTSRFFQDSPHSIKTPMASPLINLEKRPIGWDLEHDCQTALSDSGLESSTTYIEASKESRRIQRWKNFFVHKIDMPKTIYDTPIEGYSEAIDLSREKLPSDDARYFDDDPNEPRIENDNNVNCHLKVASENTEVIEPRIPEVEETRKNTEKIERPVDTRETDRRRILAESALPTEPLDDEALKNDRMSAIVKGLDLAITHRHRPSLRETRILPEIPRTIVLETDRERAKPSSIFRDRESTSILVRKTSEALSRRASSDGVESRDSRSEFFRPAISEISEVEPSVVQEEINEPEFFERIVDESENADSQTADSEIVERAPSPENFQARCKDFLIDTSTSFSSCMKLPAPVSALPTESESSRLEDTSTRFAGESMDFKVGEESDSLRSDFMPFASHGTMDSTTSGRESFFCSIAENATNPSEDCSIGRKSVDSLERYATSDCRSKESSPPAPILSFSGQIQSDSRNSDSLTKSPPNLSCENPVPKLVGKNEEESLSSLISQPVETSMNGTNDSERSIERAELETSSYPKIPKMIIRNVRSRPGSPIGVEKDETEEASRVFEVEIKMDKETAARDSIVECKIPKMKIKLEEKPRMIVEAPKLCLEVDQPKNVPKVKIRKIRRSSRSSSPIRAVKSRQSSEREIAVEAPEAPSAENSNTSGSYKFTLVEKSPKPHQSGRSERPDDESRHDRIPKLTIKKQELVTSHSSALKKRRSRSPGESGSRKRRSASKHASGKKDETRSRERRNNSPDSNEGNTDSQNPSEKVPKVIIKRTSPSAEFKCELSKVGREAITKDSKWQPEVKLQRLWVLDCMAKEPGGGKLALRMLETSSESGDKKNSDGSSGRNDERKQSRRNSPSFEGKARRRSNCELETQPRYNERARALLVGNSRSKSFDEITNANRESKAETPQASSKLKSHRTLKILKDDDFEYSGTEPKPENSSEKNERREASRKSKKSERNVIAEPENSVIKLDSSDESQTTIEILPASPDNSQPESLDATEPSSELEHSMGNAMGKLYSDEAIPTQFELELDIVDNSTVDSLDVPLPMPDESALEEDPAIERANRIEHFKAYRASAEDENAATDLGCEKFVYDAETKSISLRKSRRSTETRNVCCSDSLVKEVLAAKETLKRCLTKSKGIVRTKMKPRTKTAAEKKQGAGFDFVGLAAYAKTSRCNVEERAVFQDAAKGGKSSEVNGCSSEERAKSENVQGAGTEESRVEKKSRESSGKDSRHRKTWSDESRSSGRSRDEHLSSSTSKSSKRSSTSSTEVGQTKTSRKSNEHESLGENSRKGSADKNSTSLKSNERNSERQGSGSKSASNEDPVKEINKSYKIPKISRSRDGNGAEEMAMAAEEAKRKSPSPAKMPILEPQVHLSFELAGSDRDTSRSPPVITKQEDRRVDNEVPKKIEDNVNSDKLNSITKQQDSEAVTFANIVSQLAYHEKATIRHRRYCNLCERWFPSTVRHERHLSGYQHRHTELTQRRTVHALFMLFTGKPCPRLLPASIVRTDCLPGEPTPLQIAVQDVAISLEDGARVKPKKDVSSRDE